MKIYQKSEERTIGYLVEDKAAMHGDRTFLFFKDEQYSYNQLNQGSNRVANALKELGVKKGDKVVTLLPNFPEYFYIWWGIVKLGAWEIPINNNYRGGALVDVINRCDARLAIVSSGLFLSRFRAVQEDLEHMEQMVIAHSLKELPPSGETQDLKFETHLLADLMSASADSPGVPVFNWDPECIQYTSGTTGPPKGAVCSHELYFYFAEQKAIHMKTKARDVIYNFLPMYNMTGQVETCLTALIGDAQFALADGFNTGTFWDDIRKYNCTEFVSMGGVCSLLEKEPPRPDDADNPLERIYIVPLPVDFQKRFEKRFNVRMTEAFGQTETGVVAYRDLDNPVMGSAGREVEGFEVKIFDVNDNEVTPGTEGEIVVRPKRAHIIFEEYYKMPEKTAPALRHCWWHTGDLGKMDSEGNLYFIRRKAECIRYRGYLISTTELEKVVSQHPSVLESAAYGVPDEAGDEEDVMVAIKLKKGASLRGEDLLRGFEKEIPYYMVPRYVRFVEVFEKTPTMRIIKAGLQKEGITADTWDRRKAGFKLSRE